MAESAEKFGSLTTV